MKHSHSQNLISSSFRPSGCLCQQRKKYHGTGLGPEGAESNQQSQQGQPRATEDRCICKQLSHWFDFSVCVQVSICGLNKSQTSPFLSFLLTGCWSAPSGVKKAQTDSVSGLLCNHGNHVKVW